MTPGLVLGKLKHTLKERCPHCKAVLQLRTKSVFGEEKGVPVSSSLEFKYCKLCKYTEEIEPKRKRRRDEYLEV